LFTAIANAIFFNMGARLARYTGNDTYAEVAEKTWDWLWSVEYIDHDTWEVYDGGHVEHNCTDINTLTFSYNAGVLVQGAAHMYNYVSCFARRPSAGNVY
jgi:mannan endo-1,6-alpha-mannosidase